MRIERDFPVLRTESKGTLLETNLGRNRVLKKILILLLTGVMVLSLAACGEKSGTSASTGSDTNTPSSTTQPEAKRLGDSIETDILRITLDNAQFAIKLNSSYSDSDPRQLSDDYFTAEEYDPVNDVNSLYVAPKGHTYVAIEYTVECLDRSAVYFDGGTNYDENDHYYLSGITVEYAGEKYSTVNRPHINSPVYETNYGCHKDADSSLWLRDFSSTILVSAGEKSQYRGYIDIPVDVDDLDDDFALIFTLPSSESTTVNDGPGPTVEFKYLVTAEDRPSASESTLDEAS